MTQSVEDLFTTRLTDRTLNMIEDERGDIFWGYGHREASEFTNEVNQWLISECGATHPDDLFAASQPVEHLWARLDDKHEDRFRVVDKPWLDTKEAADDVFPVTRLLV